MSETIESKLESAAVKCATAEATLESAVAERNRAILDARAAGLSLRKIGSMAGLTHAGVAVIVNRASSSV